MKLSVIIPVYNERNTIREVLEKVGKVPVEKEIIVVDGNSTDGTKEILKEAEFYCDKIIYEDRRTGRGSAILKGLKYITGDYVIFQDADLELNPNEYPKLLEPIISGNTQVVFGSRLKNGRREMPILNFIVNKILTKLTNFLFSSSLTDVYTCYTLIKTSLIKQLNLKQKGFELNLEIVDKILKRKISIIEVLVTYNPRSYREGKKIDWLDTFLSFYTVIKYRFMD